MSLQELRTLYQAGRLLPFVGAGVSASVRWEEDGAERGGPSWDDLVEQAALDLGFESLELLRVRGTDRQILEYFKLKNSGHARLTNWLLARMQPPDGALRASGIHKELSALSKCGLFYTTNFDNFLERSFKLAGRSYKPVAVEAQMGGTSDSAEIIKFHGDWDHPDKMVLTESDFEERMAFKTPMDLRLWSDLLNRSVLFLGYSFRDPNVAYLFRQVNQRFRDLPDSQSGRRAYIVVQEPAAFERVLFRERNIEVLPVSSIK